MRALAEEQIYDGTDELIRSDPDQLARSSALGQERSLVAA